MYKRNPVLWNCLFLLFTTTCFAQQNNPRKYFDYINKAELAICDSNYHKAVKNYKEAFQYLKEPLGEDLFNFLHCGLIVADKESINLCIPKYKERNNRLPYWMQDYADTEIGRYADSLFNHHPATSKIDTNYRNLINELARIDQTVRKRPKNMIEEEYLNRRRIADSTNMALFKHYIDSSGVFPTESIIGNWYDGMSMPYEFIFIHYTGESRDSTNPINLNLDKKVLMGDFSPDFYAHLCDIRGYGLDGIMFEEARFGCDFYITVKQTGNSNYDPKDKETWKQNLILRKISSKEEKIINKNRREMNMEPYQDLIKKIQYQMTLNNTPFRLVFNWFMATVSE